MEPIRCSETLDANYKTPGKYPKENSSRINVTLHEHQYTFSIKSRLVFLTIKNVTDKLFRETRNKYFKILDLSPLNYLIHDKFGTNRPQLIAVNHTESLGAVLFIDILWSALRHLCLEACSYCHSRIVDISVN